jgi:hypothetical protein
MKECCEVDTSVENKEAVDPLVVSFGETSMGGNDSHDW